MKWDEITIKMLDDGRGGFIVAWPDKTPSGSGMVVCSGAARIIYRESPEYAMSNIDDLVNFLSRKLKERVEL